MTVWPGITGLEPTVLVTLTSMHWEPVLVPIASPMTAEVDVAPTQHAFVAGPEKALLDLVYLTPEGDSEEHLQSLRLQNLDTVRTQTLLTLAERSGKPRLIRAARHVVRMVAHDGGEPQ